MGNNLVEPTGEGLLVVPVNFAVVLLGPAGPVLRRTGAGGSAGLPPIEAGW